MSDAELKLQMIRLIDQQQGQVLQTIYHLLLSKLKVQKQVDLTPLELGYQAMAADEEREQEAFEWIEGTLNSEEL